jgi:L-alanine-DL-glutamate epimerase-like enolase superfamily enzyme
VRSTHISTVASENLDGPSPYRDLLERADVGILMADPSWIGGVTATRKVADLAALHLRPFTPHDRTGPATLAVGVYLCRNGENALTEERDLVRHLAVRPYAGAVFARSRKSSR